MNLKINEIMTANVVTAMHNEKVYQIAKLMKDHDIGAIPITEENKLVGIITDRDIVLRVCANGNEIENVVAKDIMTPNPITISPELNAKEASHLMGMNQIRRLPVVLGEDLVGIVSLGDISVVESLSERAEDTLKDISKPSEPILV